MRLAVIVLIGLSVPGGLSALAGCGRLGFAGDPHGDAPAPSDGADAAGDAPSWIAADLIARYPMDDDPQSGAIGSAELPATCTTCPTATAGVHGGGYAFDGTQTFPLPSTTLVGAAPFTVALWFRLDAYPASEGASMVEKALGTTGDQDVFNFLAYGTGGTVAAEASISASARYIESLAPVGLGEWHHAATTWDGTTEILYLDGVVQGTAPGPLDDSAEPLRVGADRDTDTLVFFFTGALDELQFYGRALGENEVARLAAP